MLIKNASAFPTDHTFLKTKDESFMTLIIKGTFVIEGHGPAQPAPEQWPIFAADEPYDVKKRDGLLRFESDMAPFKPRADIVVVGDAYALHNRPALALDVLIRVGRTEKTLRVVGDRKWSCADDKSEPEIVGPVPFVSMPLTYDRAFGGLDEHAQELLRNNPRGRGFIAKRFAAAIHGKTLPNIEDPAEPIRSWDSRPRPMGCGFLPRDSEHRYRMLGTYDEAWRAAHVPYPPDDFKFDFYNGAHPDLQVDKYLQGNEAVSLGHLIEGGGNLDFHLPCLQPVVSIQMQRGERTTAGQIPSPLDTLVFVPAQRRFYQVWRATIHLRTQDGSDVRLIQIDWQSQTPAEKSRV